MIILFFKADLWAFNDDITHPELTIRAIDPENPSIIKTRLEKDLGITKGLKIKLGIKQYKNGLSTAL